VRHDVTQLDLSTCSDDIIDRIIQALVQHGEVTGPKLNKLLARSGDGLARLDLHDSGNVEGDSFTQLPKIVAQSPRLSTLILSRLDRAVDDSTLAAIATLCPQLQTLKLVGCYAVGDVGVSTVAQKCPLLSAIDLHSCKEVTDVGVVALADHCKQLQSLSLKLVVRVTDKAVSHLFQHATQLKVLNLKQCARITDAAFAHFDCR
jgi:hypothetical protein